MMWMAEDNHHATTHWRKLLTPAKPPHTKIHPCVRTWEREHLPWATGKPQARNKSSVWVCVYRGFAMCAPGKPEEAGGQACCPETLGLGSLA